MATRTMPLSMKPIRVRAATVLALICFSAAHAFAEVRVIDGDTFETGTERIRLFGIDAPESDQPGGPQAADALRRLIGKANPNCTEVDRDRYGRMVALCSVGGADLSLAMVRAGHAVVWCHYVSKLRPNLLGPFQRAELEARRANTGIWARKFEPWRDWQCAK
jgi:endonuclease YncB( thermonuclease family)